jgi:hypothetical protein
MFHIRNAEIWLVLESDNGKLSVEIKEEKLIIENSADNTLNMEEVMLKI